MFLRLNPPWMVIFLITWKQSCFFIVYMKWCVHIFSKKNNNKRNFNNNSLFHYLLLCAIDLTPTVNQTTRACPSQPIRSPFSLDKHREVSKVSFVWWLSESRSLNRTRSSSQLIDIESSYEYLKATWSQVD